MLEFEPELDSRDRRRKQTVGQRAPVAKVPTTERAAKAPPQLSRKTQVGDEQIKAQSYLSLSLEVSKLRKTAAMSPRDELLSETARPLLAVRRGCRFCLQIDEEAGGMRGFLNKVAYVFYGWALLHRFVLLTDAEK